MNERIRELKEQAMRFAQEKCEGQSRDMYGTLRADIMTEKLAELIVRECVAICRDIDGEDNIDARSGRQDCAVEIREHFGVEE